TAEVLDSERAIYRAQAAGSGKPERAFHIAVNFMLPLVDGDDLTHQATPIFAGGLGRGTTADNPVLIEDFQRVDNAAFIPASEGGPVDVPAELQELAAELVRPFDSNLYFQGNRDFAYDGDVVYHEFTHAIVHTFVPDLLSSWHDEQGSHVEPGAMNEGWADYFSASFTNDSVTGQYSAPGLTGETGLRDADNDAACPEALIGEVHQDSLPWSGALWEIRTAVEASLGAGAIADYDRLLLTTLAEADPDESMARGAQRILDALALDPVLGPAGAVGGAIVTAAETSFGGIRHNLIGCERIWPLRTVDAAGTASVTTKALLFQPSPGEVGLSNLAPSVMQMQVEVAAGTSTFTMTWTQSAGGSSSLLG
ncbi:MAG: M36 family metallopeptidase, partial [Deltaproteobacteria bacterium]|nr:M36 family metallopeptidase [Deltaproteobacteria bacterium]